MKRITAFILAFVVLVFACVVLPFTNGIVSEDTKNGNVDEFYIYENSIVKAEGKLNTTMADYAIRLINMVNDEMLTENNKCYFALIPDKEKLIKDNYKLYDEFYSYFKNGLDFATMIDVFDTLEFSSYYSTDPHLKQDKLTDLACRLSTAMGNKSENEFETELAQSEFFGNYSKSSSLSVKGDELFYLRNDTIDGLVTKEGAEIYNFRKLSTDEPYDFFMSGNHSVLTIVNEKAENDRRLIVFRDSFFSNLAPLISCDYSEVVLVDLRYIMSEYVDEYVDFEDADVLFIYSTLLLNNSMSMK